MSYPTSKEAKVGHWNPTSGTKGWKTKGKKPTEGEGNGQSVQFSLHPPSAKGPIAEEVSDDQVNIDTARVNLSDISGTGAWGELNRPDKCSSVIDTGFNGWGLRRFARLRKYLEYLRSFYHKANLVETKEKSVEICVCEPPRVGFGNEYRHTRMGEWGP